MLSQILAAGSSEISPGANPISAHLSRQNMARAAFDDLILLDVVLDATLKTIMR